MILSFYTVILHFIFYILRYNLIRTESFDGGNDASDIERWFVSNGCLSGLVVDRAPLHPGQFGADVFDQRRAGRAVGAADH